MVAQSQFIEMFGVLQDNTKGFPQKKLGEIAFVTKLAGFEYTKYVKYKPQGDIIMVRGLNCKQGKLILDDIYWIDKETSNFLNRSQLSKGDIVLTYVGTVGEVALIEEDNKYHLAPNVAKISLYNKTENNPEYWTYALLFSRDYVTHFAASTTQAAISMEKIRDILFPIPDYQRQCAFVPIVHQADKSKFDGLKSQFISQFGNNESNPMGFMKKPISEVATLINGRAYSANELLKSGKYRVLRVGNFFSTSDYYYSDLELEPNKYCEKGDLLYAWSATFGARIWEEERVIYHYHIWKVEYDKQLLDKEFLCFLLNEMTENLKHETHGSTMMHLTKEGMERKQIIVPPIGVQKSFVLFLHQADKSKY